MSAQIPDQFVSQERKPIAVVFGGHQFQSLDRAYQDAMLIGGSLVRAGYSVRTGGYGGLMEAVSLGAANAGSPAEGIGLSNWFHETRNLHVPSDRFVETNSIFERTERLIEGAALIVALPGSVGTLGEFFLAWTCQLMGMLQSTCQIILLGNGWGPLLEVLSNHFSVSATKTTNIRVFGTTREMVTMLSTANDLVGSQKQTVEQRRWNEHALSWDQDIQSRTHYTQVEDGYNRFNEFLRTTLEKRFRPDATIEALDLGCGTGGAGQALLSVASERMQLTLDGLDFAAEMLAIAREKQVYRQLFSDELSSFRAIESAYDLIFTRGVLFSRFEVGTLKQILRCIREMLRPGGVLVFDFLNRLWSDPVASTGKVHLNCNDLDEILELVGLRITDAEGYTHRTLNIACTPKTIEL